MRHQSAASEDRTTLAERRAHLAGSGRSSVARHVVHAPCVAPTTLALFVGVWDAPDASGVGPARRGAGGGCDSGHAARKERLALQHAKAVLSASAGRSRRTCLGLSAAVEVTLRRRNTANPPLWGGCAAARREGMVRSLAAACKRAWHAKSESQSHACGCQDGSGRLRVAPGRVPCWRKGGLVTVPGAVTVMMPAVLLTSSQKKTFIGSVVESQTARTARPLSHGPPPHAGAAPRKLRAAGLALAAGACGNGLSAPAVALGFVPCHLPSVAACRKFP